MALIFILVTQLINLTINNLDFEGDHGRRLLPELRPGKTRLAKQSRVLRRLREDGPDWKIRVLIDGEFTGIELNPQVILRYVRLVFRVDGDVLCVDGAPENGGSDFLLRHRYFGCMRNFYWNSRLLESIDRSDSKLATELRCRNKGHCRYLAPFVDITLQRYPSPEKESPRKDTRDPSIVSKIRKTPPVQKTRPRDDPRPLDPSVDFEKQVRPRDPRHLKPSMESGENDIKSMQHNGTVTPQQARPRDDPRPLDPSVDVEKQVRPRDPRPLRPSMESVENGIKSMQPNGTVTPQQARSRDDPRCLKSSIESGENGIKSMQHNGTVTPQQARPRDDPRPLDPSVDLEKQVRPRDPRPLRPSMESGENDIKSMQPNGTVTPQQARLRDDPRHLDLSVDFEKQVRPRDPRHLKPSMETGENGIKRMQRNGTMTPQQARPRDDPRCLKSSIESGENGIKSMQPNGTVTPQQARPRDDPRPLDPSVDFLKQVRSRNPRPLRSPTEIEENGIKSPNGKSTSHQARARDDPRHLNRPMDSRKQVRPRDEPRPLTGEIGVKSLQSNGTTTFRQARPRDDKSLTIVVDKDGFVHGFIIVFSLVVCMYLKFLF